LADFVVPDLESPSRKGGYARGQAGLEQILRAALAVLIDEGAQALTLRRIAAVCDMNVGNLNYYFRSKQELIHGLVEAVISSYREAFEAIRHDANASAEVRLEQLVTLILKDITTQKTTHVFTELWALSNNDPVVLQRLEELYGLIRSLLAQLIGEINPALPTDERDTLALFMVGAMEGQTVFAGYEKKWVSRMPALERIARTAFVSLARTLRPGEIDGG
jgi:AcrR family transcriptional regulator